MNAQLDEAERQSLAEEIPAGRFFAVQKKLQRSSGRPSIPLPI